MRPKESSMHAVRMLALLGLALFLGAAPLDAEERADWYPSRFGAEDRVGAANHLAPEIVKAAAGLVTTGKAYSLGIEVGPDTPAYPPRTYQIVITQSNDGTGSAMGENLATANDDLLISYLGIGSQIDGLGHLGIDHRYYNGLHAKDFVAPTGLRELGTHAIPPIATRGVLLDMAALRGVATVPEGTAYNRAEIEAAAKRQGIEIRKGDVVIFHSGWHVVRESDPERWWQRHPGLGVEGARYLADRGVVAVGADTTGVEVIPFENEARPFEVHQTLLAKSGVYILENLWTNELAADGAHEFLFVLGQPKFVGAVQMVINPIAIR
jgi:kynurenine formamidase